MKSSVPLQNLLRKRLFGWIAFFLLLYTVADSSVLEYYCGNENLGIESYNQVFDDHQKPIATTETVFAVEALSQSLPEQVPDSPAQCNECLCSCSHVIVSNYYLEQFEQLISYEQQHFSLPKYFQSESHPQIVLRPPRTA